MKIALSLVLGVFPFLSSCSEPHVYQWGRMTQIGELPCFSVADSEETRRTPPKLAALVIEGLKKGQRAQVVWNLTFVGEQEVQLPPTECIPYGDSSRGVKAWPDTAPPLQAGVVYTYSFNSDIPAAYADGSLANRVYAGDFCLTRDSEGHATFHEIRWDEKAKKRHWEVCELAPEQVPTY